MLAAEQGRDFDNDDDDDGDDYDENYDDDDDDGPIKCIQAWVKMKS